MKIKRVIYSALFNIGDYENEKIGFEVELEEGESADDAIAMLRDKAVTAAQPDSNKVWRERSRLQVELRELEQKLTEARSKWAATAEFLTKQGIKTDVQPFPELVNLLPAVENESTEVIDATPF
ncbi:hypothetical protein IQ268_11185 [Oculatella sp. LEGE 06141]|uniref:hypothetical protein n=1 Tax=Oculatella sp. LEGE 06141 TaxID=1828648 RepID=UPI001881F119|nr:hypothetical protein [Oculatella sp. LEGE 06141]MBE9179125.1 hypothetical protein [Oculatella sp. LEGE 06141]